MAALQGEVVGSEVQHLQPLLLFRNTSADVPHTSILEG